MEPTIFERLNNLDTEQDLLNQKYASLREEALATAKGMIAKFGRPHRRIRSQEAPQTRGSQVPQPQRSPDLDRPRSSARLVP